MTVKKAITLVLIALCQIAYSQSSALSEGSWFKIGITEAGIYKIDRNTLDALGIGSADPTKIGIYGNGVKGILPQPNAEERPIDLQENAIYVESEDDGSFDAADYILFYGIGPDETTWSASGFQFGKNIYSDTAYYFLKIGNEDGKRIQSKSSIAGTATYIATEFDDHITFEEDNNNLISTGRNWIGQLLTDGGRLTFRHQIDGLSSEVAATITAISQSSEGANFEVFQDEDLMGSFSIASVPSGIYSLKARESVNTYTLPQKETFDLEIEYDGNATNSKGFLDRYFLTFQRTLALYNFETDFRVVGHEGELIQYNVSGGNGATVWDITDPVNVLTQEATISGSDLTFQSQSNTIEEYVVFQGSDFPTPFVFGDVSNQNLRGETNFDGLIIVPANLLAEANRLAQFHRNHDGLNVKVSTLRQVYNEFSSGRQDVTAIRDYARYVYQTGGNLKYLLLFGDCSYDYKDRIGSNTNVVPTYESRESYHPIFSYSSDDYFAFFEEEEGQWDESFSGDHTMEIGVGRLPVNTIEEAQNVVDKIIYYSTSPNTLGDWKNEITYLADDGDFNIHARHVEELSELIDTTYAQYNINKLLIDNFDQELGVSEESGITKVLSPQATAAVKTRIKEGTFYINYIGHGNESLLAEEEVITNRFIERLTNRDKLPILVTATCEFGRYDNPLRLSGAERLLLSTQGGGIALLTTSRPVFASTNFALNQAFHETIFEKVAGQNQRLGDIIRTTKNEGLAGPVNRNFTLLGDPMMFPAFPKLDITINELSSELDTLSALEEVSFSGEIQLNGAKREDFNGQLVVAIFDVKQNFQTRGQESSPYTYTLRSNALFRGEATVENGEFNFTFIVPKNISYQFERGKISMYAWDEQNNIDAVGSSRAFLVGGTNESAAIDETSPIVEMYLNDRTFSNGDVVGSSSILVAEINDESGITTSRSGVVEGITLELDGQVINLNDFYTAVTDSYQEGTVVFPIQDLAAGSYRATLKVWDTHNNSTETTIDFNVTDEPTLFVFNSSTYPNPIEDQATFYFEHDREEEELSVSLIVYGSKGEVAAYNEYLIENSERIIEIPWQPTTNSGQQLPQGIYYSRLVIKSNLDGAVKEITQKLVITD